MNFPDLIELLLVIVGTGVVAALVARLLFRPGKALVVAWAIVWAASAIALTLYLDSLHGGDGIRDLFSIGTTQAIQSEPTPSPAPSTPRPMTRPPEPAQVAAEIERKYGPR